MLLSKSLRLVHHLQKSYIRRISSESSSSDVVKEGDSILLRLRSDPAKPPLFTQSVKLGSFVNSRYGRIDHSDIIGKEYREVVNTTSGSTFRIQRPTLEEYVTLTPRSVTPVYATDANVIISALDLHPSQGGDGDCLQSPLEILEAGTGNGALTLHLARAIHAANAVTPPEYREILLEEDYDPRVDREALVEKFTKWKDNRRAIVHTIDILPNHTNHAKKIARGFRHGLYAGNVEFYTGDVSEWIARQSRSRFASQQQNKIEGSIKPFLSHVILDLPSADEHLAAAAAALHPGGVLIVFNPSISQLQECMRVVRGKRLPLYSEKVLELAAGWTGGREWDVRPVKPRKLLRQESEGTDGTVTELELPGDQETSGYEMVSRPLAWARVIGGGFLGIWRKKRANA